MNSDYTVLNRWLEQNFGFQMDVPIQAAPTAPALKAPPNPWSTQQRVIIPTDAAIRPHGALWEQLNRPLVPHLRQTFDLSSVTRAFVDFLFHSRFALDLSSSGTNTLAIGGSYVDIPKVWENSTAHSNSRDLDLSPEEVVDIAIAQILHAADEDPVWRGEALAYVVGPQTHAILQDAFYALWQAIAQARGYILGNALNHSRIDQVAYGGWRGLDLVLDVIVTNPRSFHPHVD